MDAKTNLKSRLPGRYAAEGEVAPARGVSLENAATENAATSVAAFGGAANVVLHLPAMTHECGIAFTLFDVAEIFKKTPNIAGLKPGGRYVAKDLVEVGGVPPLTHPGGKAEKISYADQ